jgi:hypothetical protein
MPRRWCPQLARAPRNVSQAPSVGLITICLIAIYLITN